MPVSFSDLATGLSKLGLTKNLVIAHASLRAFGPIEGGAETMLNALLDSVRGIIMPTFTYKTMLNPEIGPPKNGITYGSDSDLNKMAECFHPDMPVDPTMGVLPEVLRKHPKAKRSSHPIQSFAGIRADALLNTQTIYNPLAPFIEKYTRRVEIGNALVQAMHLKSLIKVVVDQLKENPFALLCDRQDCERCTAVRWS